MGMTIGNIAVKTDNRNLVISFLKNNKERAYIAGQVNGWVAVFPENEAEFPDQLFTLAAKLSLELKTLVSVGRVYASDDFWFEFYDNGKCVIDYLDAPATEGLLTSIRKGNSLTLKKYAKGDQSVKKIKKVLTDSYTFAEDRYLAICKILGLPEFLRHWSFHCLSLEKERGNFDKLLKEDKIPSLRLYI